MKTKLFIIALAFGVASCSSSEANTEGTEAAGTTQDAGEKLKEIERLGEEREKYMHLAGQAAEAMNMEEMNLYNAKMDSIDVLYQEALRR